MVGCVIVVVGGALGPGDGGVCYSRVMTSSLVTDINCKSRVLFFRGFSKHLLFFSSKRVFLFNIRCEQM